MISDEGYIDGSWKLTILSRDLNGVLTSRVFNNTSIGDIFQNTIKYFQIPSDQSKNFSFWCPVKNVWINKNQSDQSLYQLSLNANTDLLFLRKIRPLKIISHDRRLRNFDIDYSEVMFNVLKTIGNYFGFVEHQFLCLSKYSNSNVDQEKEIDYFDLNEGNLNPKRLSKNMLSYCPWTPTSGYGSLSLTASLDNFRGSILSIKDYLYTNKSNEIVNGIYKRDLKQWNDDVDRGKLNKTILIQSQSLMEQNVDEKGIFRLKIRYPECITIESNDFLHKKIDCLYEEIREMVLSSETDMSNSLSLVFAGLFFHNFVTKDEQNHFYPEIDYNNPMGSGDNPIDIDQEIENLLTDLEINLLRHNNKNNYSVTDGYVNMNQTNSNKRNRIYCKVTVDVRQCLPKTSIHLYKKMQLIISNNRLELYKENNSINVQYLFDMQLSKIDVHFGQDPNDNKIFWTFFYSGKMIKIGISPQNDDDFILIGSIGIGNSNYFLVNSKQIDDIQSIFREILKIIRYNGRVFYNIFNMPKISVGELFRYRQTSDGGSVRDQLEHVLRYYSSIRHLSVRDVKMMSIQLWNALPRSNYHYFNVTPLPPNDLSSFSLVAICSEKILLINAGFVPVYSLQWGHLKNWKINTETNSISMTFQYFSVSFGLIDCLAISFHEMLSFFIWLKGGNEQVNRNGGKKTADLYNLMINMNK